MTPAPAKKRHVEALLVGLAPLQRGFRVEAEMHDHVGAGILEAADNRVVVGLALVIGLGDEVDALVLVVGGGDLVLTAAIVLVGPQHGRLLGAEGLGGDPRLGGGVLGVVGHDAKRGAVALLGDGRVGADRRHHAELGRLVDRQRRQAVAREDVADQDHDIAIEGELLGDVGRFLRVAAVVVLIDDEVVALPWTRLQPAALVKILGREDGAVQRLQPVGRDRPGQRPGERYGELVLGAGAGSEHGDGDERKQGRKTLSKETRETKHDVSSLLNRMDVTRACAARDRAGSAWSRSAIRHRRHCIRRRGRG